MTSSAETTQRVFIWTAVMDGGLPLLGSGLAWYSPRHSIKVWSMNKSASYICVVLLGLQTQMTALGRFQSPALVREA